MPERVGVWKKRGVFRRRAGLFEGLWGGRAWCIGGGWCERRTGVSPRVGSSRDVFAN